MGGGEGEAILWSPRKGVRRKMLGKPAKQLFSFFRSINRRKRRAINPKSRIVISKRFSLYSSKNSTPRRC